MKRFCKKAICYFSCLVNYILYNLFRLTGIDEKTIVFESEGDCSDNAYALFEYLQNSKALEEYNIVWLVEHPEKFNSYKNVRYAYKFDDRISILRDISLARCKRFIYDHCNVYLVGRLKYAHSTQQLIVYLTHGCGFKAVSLYEGFDVCYVTGKLYIPVYAETRHCKEEQIKDLGFSRLDYFFQPLNDKQISFKQKHHFSSYPKIILWMPTFRRSHNKSISEEYFKNYTGLPILESEEQLAEFDSFLHDKNILCIFKVHHLQAELPVFKRSYKNLLLLNDEDIDDFGLQLYQIIGLTDVLITDYSSVSNDYQLLDRPIIYTLDDFEKYKSSRGFIVDDPLKYYVGHHVYTGKELYNSILDIIENGDRYRDERNRIMSLMHTYTDGNSSKRIAHDIGIE